MALTHSTSSFVAGRMTVTLSRPCASKIAFFDAVLKAQ